ncbi:hypothetical protein WN51_07084 [Melipona quadrifasciata]|uniref:Uncharacterized protein n=1 Tax=Melipona quadrifasciata TaxID=166423 RepID=A0A0M8ZR88_9HYME|nr:hypothetical protein WN51_07084 [Melipona quadrifasciata]
MSESIAKWQTTMANYTATNSHNFVYITRFASLLLSGSEGGEGRQVTRREPVEIVPRTFPRLPEPAD